MKDQTLSQGILKFYKEVGLDFQLPAHVTVLDPYGDPGVWKVVRSFYRKFYADAGSRVILFGINPGRFGAGVTGVPFTDPIRLEQACGIANGFQKRGELSSEFVYEVVNAWGGSEAFYSRFFISALSPLGFVSEGKNLNYYDDKVLQQAAGPYILKKVRHQQQMLRAGEVCFCLGEGTNYKYFSRLNEREKLFREIIPLPHPRWVMQYRRKRKQEYIDLYVEKLAAVLEKNN